MRKIFKLSHNTVFEVNKDVSKLGDIAKEAGDKAYIKLFCEDTTNLIDNIALNIIPRPETALFNVVMQELDKKINLAVAAHFPTQYNIGLTANVVSCKKGTYIILSGVGNFWEQAFQSTDLDELNEHDSNKILDSNNLTVAYSKQLYPHGNIDIKDADMIFPSVQQRASIKARHHIQHDLLKRVASGSEIQNYQLMNYMDQVIDLLSLETVKKDITETQRQLAMILPVITPEMVKLNAAEYAAMEAQKKQNQEQSNA
ncbi:MAG: hypothetical protein IJ192_05290 [Clostridia bacterium]|nr:hypothetical protein [Clostridia bacterium]